MTAPRTRVLIVDDAELVREALTAVLASDPSIEVVGAACDAYEARTLIKETNPDVVTLDIEMPRMDGITFLRKLMRLHPLPVVMISSLTDAGAASTLEALEIGAVDFVPKNPPVGVEFDAHMREIIAKVKAAGKISRTSVANRAAIGREAERVAARRAELDQRHRFHGCPDDHLVLLGASTGGTEAIRRILEVLPAEFPPILVVQHIPVGFCQNFATRLDGCSRLAVQIARQGDRIEPGHVYIAPGDRHFEVVSAPSGRTCGLIDAPPVNNHRPSIDVLFRSVATLHGVSIAAAILTGMGCDGANGLRTLRDQGARTFAQEQSSCVVWGMPRAALELGAVEEVLSIDDMTDAIARTVLLPAAKAESRGNHE